ncbi:hypothetical protein ACH4NS_09300 [Streptomyces mutabilis]|jgi:hypothetical protein|nr:MULTISPECIES: hypothetical protein [unclassified Streptomyces]MDG9692380.1 hypothetical protein [Streptomyces sp. DH17]MDN3250165.1 hypothetical protein [Streptomyces sp. ZSW22]MDN3254877.1 hypothetical protein [Streptomyces sp. MA25(2023)]MDQ0385293.1 hypothetical protein [Streptomyces sp. DSM 42143]PAK27440.1 hypothetical protein CJD44_04410 [Streptomyces sp. alain-838]
MALKKAIACTVTALVMAGGAAGTAAAADDDTSKFENNSQVLSCDVVEVIDIPILSAANNNIDCSDNNKEEEDKELHIVDESDNSAEAAFFLQKD